MENIKQTLIHERLKISLRYAKKINSSSSNEKKAKKF